MGVDRDDCDEGGGGGGGCREVDVVTGSRCSGSCEGERPRRLGTTFVGCRDDDDGVAAATGPALLLGLTVPLLPADVGVDVALAAATISCGFRPAGTTPPGRTAVVEVKADRAVPPELGSRGSGELVGPRADEDATAGVKSLEVVVASSILTLVSGALFAPVAGAVVCCVLLFTTSPPSLPPLLLLSRCCARSCSILLGFIPTANAAVRTLSIDTLANKEVMRAFPEVEGLLSSSSEDDESDESPSCRRRRPVVVAGGGWVEEDGGLATVKIAVLPEGRSCDGGDVIVALLLDPSCRGGGGVDACI